MFRLTTLATRATVVTASAAVHAALILAPMGHPRSAEGAGADTVEVEVLSAPAEVVEVTDPAPATPHGGGVPWHTHTHPYPVPASHDWTPHDPNLVHAFAAPTPAPAVASPAIAEEHDDHDAHPHDEHEEMAHFTMAIGSIGSTGAGAADGHGAAGAQGIASAPVADASPVSESTVDSRARLVRGVAPSYPSPARAEGVEGSVRLELVVSPSGSVESARVLRGIGHGLDEAALDAARRFAFAPAIKAGRAVRVRMGWSVEFRLQ
jgi:protein TonB